MNKTTCKIWLLALLLIGAPLSAEQFEGDVLAERVQAIVQVSENVQGSFTQKKFIEVLPHPLRSSGEFAFSRDGGLLWKTLEPIASELHFNHLGISQQVDGETLWAIDPNQPITVALTQVLTGILSSNWEVLQEYFVLAGSIEEGRWSVQLTPKELSWSTVIDRLQVKGGGVVESIVMFEPNQERTEINLDVTYADSH
ncbi:outer membrane lipoprotein carrier protein LolA [Aurantivibrio plasticivorans]